MDGSPSRRTRHWTPTLRDSHASGTGPIWTPRGPIPDGYRLSTHDNLPARHQGPWARDKLRFLELYQDPALAATKRKRGNTHYVDLFAGPGRTVSYGNREFKGSPIQALHARHDGDGWVGRFGSYHFCNLDDLDYWLLERRIDLELRSMTHPVDRRTIHHHHGDANEKVVRIMNAIPKWGYALVFADIEGPKDLPFETIRELRRLHDSVDLYVLFPNGIGESRTLPFDQESLERFRPMWDAYFGTPTWWDIVQETRRTSKDRPRMMGKLRELYLGQLRRYWDRAEKVMHVRKDGTKKYDMLLASNSDAAWQIADWASRESAPRDLFDGTPDDPRLKRTH